MTKNWAIVIGIDRYDHLQSLEYAGKDALRINVFLQQELEFDQIFLFTDDSPDIGNKSTRPTLTNLLKVLDDIFAKPFMGAGDNFWFFFSGHGIPHQGRDYLMPADGYPSNVERTAIAVDYIRDKLRCCGADNVIMILDACRKSSTRAGEGVGRQSAEAARQMGVISIFSCSPNQYSYEIADLQQGAFTHALLEGLGIRGQCATIERLNQYLSQRVPELVWQYKRDHQNPYTITEPTTKSHLILNRRYATLAEIAVLKNDAYQAEVYQDYALARQLWIRVLAAAAGSDMDAINAIQRIAIHQSGTAVSSSSDTTANRKFTTPASPSLQETAAIPSDKKPNTFAEYRKILATLTGDLQQLQRHSHFLSLNDSIQGIDNILERVSSIPFSVAVVGEFRRGKTTLVNALLGQSVLPDIGIRPAVSCRVTYGVRPRVRVVYRDGDEDEITIDQLEDYLTRLAPGSIATAAQVASIVVYYPTSYCQNNVDIIDTCGLGDDISMTEVTLSVLPCVDVAIMVIEAQHPFSEFEQNFLETKLLTNDLDRIIFAVTGIDRFNNSEDADKSIQYIKDQISKLIIRRGKNQYGENSPEYKVYQKKTGSPKVIGVSACQALQAKQTGNEELLLKSRFPEFEAQLEDFLIHERCSASLQILINRLITSAVEILSALDLQQTSLGMLSEQQQKELIQMSTETRQILGNAQRLSEQLIKEVDVSDSSSQFTTGNDQNLDENLKSTSSADYTKLRDYLKAQQWQEANQETEMVMLEVTGCEKEGWMDSSAIDCFPIADLRTIDQLWLKYTNSHFGFSTQKKIFKQVNQKEQSFLQKVNWNKASLRGGIFLKENHLNFNLEAPEGHLPMVFGGEHSWIFSAL
jgi:uncharacterized caspase-like protein/predicted GTPase